MLQLPEIYRRLQRVADVSVDRAFAEALPTADAPAVRLIATSLLRRQQAVGCAALVRHFHQCPVDIQAQIVRQAATWDQALREVAGYRLPYGAANVVQLIVAGRICHLAYLITEQLRHRPPEVRSASAQGLLELARWAATNADGRPARCGAAAAGRLQAAIGEAVGCYRSHQQPAVLLALLAFAPRPVLAALGAAENRPNALAVGALSGLLAEAKQCETRRAMLVMVRSPLLAPSVVQGIGVAGRASRLDDVLSCWHLLLDQRVVEPLRSAALTGCFWPAAGRLARWPAHATGGLARWAAALPLTDQQRVRKLARLAALPDAMSRLGALRGLMAMSGPQGPGGIVEEAVSRFCRDPQAALARIALHHLVASRWTGLTALLPRLINSPHQEVSRIAGRLLAPLGFERLWSRWPRMLLGQRLSLGRALIKIDPQFHSQLGRRLASGARPDKLQALSIVCCLGQGFEHEAVLLKATGHADARIASAAVRAIGSARSPRAVDVLAASLRHDDVRVRANAIEALGQLRSTRHIQTIGLMAQEEQGRPRANAIRVLLELPAGDALDALSNMLHDSRPSHRTSALWVVQAMGLLEVAGRVAEMSITDRDGHVRERADAVVHGLISLMDGDAVCAGPVTTDG